MLRLQNYDDGLQYGARIYGPIFVATTSGVVPNNVFTNSGFSTAPSSGTVVAFVVLNTTPTVVGGTIALWGTTAGTIATVNMGGNALGTGAVPGSVGSSVFSVMTGTNVLNAAVVTGDTLQVNSIGNSGTAVCFVIFANPF